MVRILIGYGNVRIRKIDKGLTGKICGRGSHIF